MGGGGRAPHSPLTDELFPGLAHDPESRPSDPGEWGQTLPLTAIALRPNFIHISRTVTLIARHPGNPRPLTGCTAPISPALEAVLIPSAVDPPSLGPPVEPGCS